ncbi:ANTAR domain-containing protein [Streptomyces capoamus]|uniref:ANTAR domain-containing protein n=1 Tax=Streptomyces capoamus TaxID=68183 RepID=UPI003C30AFCD
MSGTSPLCTDAIPGAAASEPAAYASHPRGALQLRGSVTGLGRISPDDGFTVLREISQHTNIRLSTVAEHVLRHAQGAALPNFLLEELRAALAHHARPA